MKQLRNKLCQKIKVKDAGCQIKIKRIDTEGSSQSKIRKVDSRKEIKYINEIQ